MSRRVYHQSSIENFKSYLRNTDWDSIISIQEKTDSNDIYELFINIFNIGFNKYFPKKLKTSYKKCLGKSG